ncbi:MAG: squalene/phytoene synthase family protein, partial [Thiohalomonadales bacterium]
WWRESMEKTYNGYPQHPIQFALVGPIEKMNLPLSLFLEIIQGMEMDLQQSRYHTFEELQHYCYLVASTVGLLAVRIFGYNHNDVLKYAENLGFALQLTNIVRDVREDASRGRIYLPLQELEKHGVTEQNILEHRHGPAMNALLAEQVKRAHSYYDLAFSYLPDAERQKQRCGIIMSELYRRILVKIEKDAASVLDKRISLSPMHKLWIAWTTYRRENKCTYSK